MTQEFTQDEIIEMAVEAGIRKDDVFLLGGGAFVAFAKLVAAKEREACCGGDVLNAANINGNDEPHQVVDKYRAAIRARGTP